MANAAYDSDLTVANSGELTDGTYAAAPTWDESSDAAWDDAAGLGAETDFYIQGVECSSSQFTKTGVGTIIYNNAADFPVDTDGAVLIWTFWASPPSLATYANGGVRTIVGSSFGDFYAWLASGSNFEPNPLGGWYCFAVNPNDPAGASESQLTANDTVGSPSATVQQYFGIAINATAQARGNPFAVDAIRSGRCTMEVTDGVGGTAGTFAGMATFDESTNERYGLFMETGGSYRWQGLMSLGVTATAVIFDDSNRNIVMANTPVVSAAFSRIEIHHVDSDVTWTTISFSNPGINDVIAASACLGNLELIDSATLAFTGCSFTDMGTFIFDATTNTNVITSTTFRRCGLVTQGSATFTGCIFDSCTTAISLSANNCDVITNCIFTSDGSNHAIEITTTGDHDITGCTFTSYGSDGTTNAVIYNNSGGAVTINSSGNTGTITVLNESPSTTTVVASVPITIDIADEGGAAVANAQVYIQKSSVSYNYSSDAGNTAADADFIVNEVVDTDIPVSGWLHVWDKSGNTKQNYRYSSWTSKTFTLNSEVTGTANAGGSGTVLEWKTGSTGFDAQDIVEGDTIRNTTDGSWAIVDEIVDNNSITTSPLQGGSDDTWQENDVYSLHKLAISYTDVDDLVDIPLINIQSNGTGDANGAYNWGAIGTPLAVKIRIRSNHSATKYISYDTTGTISSTGYSLTAILTEDTVAT